MADQGDGGGSGRGSFDKATVDRWQVFGGMAGVAALLLSVIGGLRDLVPLSLVASGVVTLVGVGLLYRWGRRPRQHVARNFVVPVVLTVAGAATAGVLGGMELRSPAGAGEGASADSSGTRRGDAPAERRNEHVTLNSDFHIDLDTTTAEHRGVARQRTDDTDLHFITSVFVPVELAVVPAPPSYRDCVDATALTTELPTSRVVDGVAFCVKTTEGRWAGVTVTDVTKVGGSVLEFDLVVWEKPA